VRSYLATEEINASDSLQPDFWIGVIQSHYLNSNRFRKSGFLPPALASATCLNWENASVKVLHVDSFKLRLMALVLWPRRSASSSISR
jgi:hypothetical protein